MITTMRTALATSFGSIDTLRDNTRLSALMDFAFFANHVLGLDLSPEDCEAVQDAVMDSYAGLTFTLQTKRPNAVGSALALWLKVKGHVVITSNDSFDVSQHEPLHWLFGDELTASGATVVSIELMPHCVSVTWSKLS